MFLTKKEDIAFFNKVMDEHGDLEPYFAELAIWAWIYQRDKYLDLIEECKKQQEEGTVDKVVEALNGFELQTIHEEI
jgi:hypothetical protein